MICIGTILEIAYLFPHPGWIAAKGPHQWKNRQFLFFAFFGFFRSMEKIASDGPKWSREDFFPTNPDLANILGRPNLDFGFFFIFCILWTPNFWISRSPDLQIPRFPDFQTTPPPPEPPPPPAPEEFSDPNLTPLPTHPGIKYVARALAAMCSS